MVAFVASKSVSASFCFCKRSLIFSVVDGLVTGVVAAVRVFILFKY
jgi:hypothetical protein